MPKEIVTNNYWFFYCELNETRRQFQSEKEFKTYTKRHCASCEGCKNGLEIPAYEDSWDSCKKTKVKSLR